MSERAKDRTGLRAKDAVLPAELIPMAATAEQLGFMRAPDPCCPAGDGRPDSGHDDGHHVHAHHGDEGHHGDGDREQPPPQQPDEDHQDHSHMRVFPVFSLNQQGELVESVDQEGRLSAGTKRALAEATRKHQEEAGRKGHAAGDEGGQPHAKPAAPKRPRKKR